MIRFKLWQWAVLLMVWLVPLQAGGTGVVAEGRPALGGMDYVTLRGAWYEVQAALNREEWAEAQARLAQVRKVKLNLGLPNLFKVSAVLIRAAERAAESGDNDAALSLANIAQSMSPDMAVPHFEQATRTLEADVFQLPETLKHLRRGYEILGTDPLATSIFIANAASGFVLLSLILLLFFVAVHVVRYGRCLVRDTQRLMRESIDRFQGGILLLALALTPLVLGLGLVISMMIWLLVLSVYSNRMERGMTVLLLLLGGSLGVVSDAIDRATLFPSSPEYTIYQCNMGACTHQERTHLEALQKDPAHRYAASYTLAQLDLRTIQPSTERLNRSRNLLETAWTTEDTWQARVLHGNIAYAQALTHCDKMLQGDKSSGDLYEQGIEEAQNYWEIAAGKNTNSVEAHYNLSVAAQLLGHPDRESAHLTEANGIDAARVGEFQDRVNAGRTEKRCAYWAQPNRHVMTPTGPRENTAGNYFQVRGESSGIRAPFSQLLSGSFGPTYLAWTGWIGAGVVFLLLFLGRFSFLSCPCRKCPSVASPTSRVDVPEGAVCEDCVLADVGRGVVDAKSQWRREQRANLRRARRIRNQQLVSWVVPGFATALIGRPIRGLLAGGIFFGCLLWATDIHVVAEYVHQATGPSLGRTIPLILIAATIYIGSLVRVHRRRGLHE